MEKLCLSVVKVICWENLLLREYKLGWDGHSVLSIIQQKYLEGEREAGGDSRSQHMWEGSEGRGEL